MMKSLLFKDCFDLAIFESIPYIMQNETSESMKKMLTLIMSKYSYKPADYLLLCYHDKELTASEIGGAIDLEYADKWKQDKARLETQYEIAYKTTTVSKDYERNVYGYNASDTGVKDYDDATTTTTKTNLGNVIDSITKDLALRTKLRYYNIVITDIGNLLTLQVYDF